MIGVSRGLRGVPDVQAPGHSTPGAGRPRWEGRLTRSEGASYQ
jgi:hypothetical protein